MPQQLDPSPLTRYPAPPYPEQKQSAPGSEAEMNPKPDYGEESYVGSGKLTGKAAIITGGDSGIGRAVALAFAREGADIVVSYLDEDKDAEETKRVVEAAGRKCVLVPGDITDESHCQSIVQRAVDAFGKVDVLVNNAAYQRNHEKLEDMPSSEFERTFRTNIFAMFYFVKAAVPHMAPGSSIINTASIQADDPSASLLAYASTKGAIHNFTGGLAGLLGEKGIRANTVSPGPVWTPLIPATMPVEMVKTFGGSTPTKRAAQPVELAPAYVLLASNEASYISGANLAVTGGQPFL